MFTCRRNAHRLTTLVVAISGMLFSGLEAGADDHQAKLPAAVRKTLKLEAGKAEVEDIQKRKSGKSTVWEIDVIQSGKSYELHIAADGTLIHKQLEGDDEGADEASDEKAATKSPSSTKKMTSSAKSSAKNKEGEDDEEEDDDDGEEEDEGDDEDLSIKDLPKAVRNALKREAAGGDIEEIEREREDGVTIYEATVEFDTDDESSDDDEDEDEGDDDEEDDEDQDDDDEEIVYELKFSKAGILLSKILVDEDDDEDDQ